MDRRGGCCIERYAGGGGAYEEKKLMERAMLKFRPIAPKPITGAGSTFGSSSSDNKTSSVETTYVKATGRGKRKYNIANKTRKRNSNGGAPKRVRVSHQENGTIRSGESSGVVTLPLLPESPTIQSNSKIPTSLFSAPPPIFWLSFNNSKQKQAVESVVTVECVSVTDIWGGEGLGRTDEERLRNLESDTCPGFITDAQRRVKWINRAYKSMLRVDDRQLVVVRVDNNMKDDISWVLQGALATNKYPVFNCRVRVQQHSSTKEVKILPCDVWRMDCGGLAWRLDVKAALSLGR